MATAAVTCVTFMLRHWTIRFCLVIMEIKRRGRAVKVIQIFVVQFRTTSSPGQVSLISKSPKCVKVLKRFLVQE